MKCNFIIHINQDEKENFIEKKLKKGDKKKCKNKK